MYSALTLKEAVAHGTRKKPLMSLHFTTGPGTAYPDGFFVERHWHPDVELILIRRGTYLCERNLETYEMSEGDLAVINSGELHQLTGMGPDTVHDVVLFGPDLVDFAYPDEWQEQWSRPFLNRELELVPWLSPAHPAYSRILNLFNGILDSGLKKEEGWYLTCKLRLLELFVILIQRGLVIPPKKPASAMEFRKITHYKTVTAYIEEHFEEPVTLEQLSALIPCSPHYLCRFFKEISGVSPIQYLISRRLDHASILLANTSSPILQVALDCGFENVSYFIRKFKESRGCTPREFRQAAKHKNTRKNDLSI